MHIPAFEIIGKVERVLVANKHGNHISFPAEKIQLIQGQGVRYDNHYGPRLLDIRDSTALRFGLLKGMESFNVRQWSAVSQEELNTVAQYIGIKEIGYGLLGENFVVSGIQDFTTLPTGTQFFFKSPKDELRSTILFVYGENNPCQIPGDAIQAANPDVENVRSLFIKNAKHRRGLVGFIIGSGFVKEGDSIIAAIPDQHIYKPHQLIHKP